MIVATMAQRVRVLRNTLRWFPSYIRQRLAHPAPPGRRLHLILAMADHFEPGYVANAPAKAVAPLDEQRRRLDRWCREYPRALDAWRDSDGRPFRHTYFYPIEQFHYDIVEQLASHCHAGWGELEIHLHHGVDVPDTSANLRKTLRSAVDTLAALGCLSRWQGSGPSRYAFVHGNWALGNVNGGPLCGVDDEMQILAETGCYADLTLPSAPDRSQISKINALYECALPLEERAPHRLGRDLRVGRPPEIFPLIVQGPLGLRMRRARALVRPYIDSAEVSGQQPLTLDRLHHWLTRPIAVHGRSDWVFLKLHCHGMDSRDESAMYGPPMQRFLRALTEEASSSGYLLHFVTAREMVNIILAACDGRKGNPADHRDYRLMPIRTSH